MSINLFPHQQTAVDKMHNGCVLMGGVGTGKSITAMAYFVSKVCKGTYGDPGSMRTPRDVYIITTAKKRDSLDWDKEAAAFRIGKDRDESVSGIQLTIDSWNNIGKYTGVHDAFFIFDEQRIVGSGAWTKAFIHIAKSNEWVMLSATPGDTWLDYIPLFVANGFYKNRTAFKREHVVYSAYTKFPKVEKYLGTSKLARFRDQILVEMPYDRHTTRIGKTIDVAHDVDLLEKVMKKKWHVYEERPLRDVSEMFSVMRRVVNSDSSRITALREVMKKHPRVIVFYNFNYELETLRSMGEELRLEESQHLETLKTPNPSKPTRSGQPTTCDTCGKKTSEPSSENLSSSSKTSPDRWEKCGEWTECPDGNGDLWVPCREKMRVCGGETPWSYHTAAPVTSTGILADYATISGVDPSASRQTPLSGVRPLKNGSLKDSGSVRSQSTKSEGLEDFPPLTQSFAIAEWNGQKHEKIPETDSWLYLVQYYAGAEGWNCVETDAIVFYSLTYSFKQFEQAHGRIDRLNTPFENLYYYYFRSDSAIDRAIWRSLTEKKNFNERDFVM